MRSQEFAVVGTGQTVLTINRGRGKYVVTKWITEGTLSYIKHLFWEN